MQRLLIVLLLVFAAARAHACMVMPQDPSWPKMLEKAEGAVIVRLASKGQVGAASDVVCSLATALTQRHPSPITVRLKL